MIVRILGEGQYDVSDEALDRLNELDAAVEAAVEAGDVDAFGTALAALLDGVRTVGVPHDAETPRRVRPDPAARRRQHRRRPRAAQRRRPDPRLGRLSHTGRMPRTRFIKDIGLTARMTTVMFLLGALFVVLIVG